VRMDLWKTVGEPVGEEMTTEVTGPGFIHLRVLSAFSLLEGALPVKLLAKLAKADNQPALAITDRNNLFGALEFSQILAGEGVQPIIGLTLAVRLAGQENADTRLRGSGGPNTVKTSQHSGYIAVLAQDAKGYDHLMQLTSLAFLEHSEEGVPYVTEDELKSRNEGLLVLTGGPESPIDQALRAGNDALAEQWLASLSEFFPGRLYVELQRHGLAHEREVESRLLELAYSMQLPLVATNQAYFPTPEDFDAHDALITIADGAYIVEDDRRRLSPEHYFKSRENMISLFADLPEALESTVEIARRCAFRPRTRGPILPRFVGDVGDPAAQELAEANELERQAWAGLTVCLEAQGGPAAGLTEADYRQRLELELSVIARMKYPGYFLIVSDFIKWAKANDIPVGPGRGSGAGSLVAWTLTITDLDPLRFGLLFERFLNPERVSMPDFDIDFCQERRDEVIRYVQEKYGKDRVAQIITFGKLQARAVLRDVGRVLQVPYGQVDRLCKLVPNNPANPVTLKEAIEGEPKLQEARDGDPIVKQMLDIGQKLEGLYRHASTHAAGVVIGDRPLIELAPLYRDPRSDLPVTQFNMKWVEPAGLVKFDFLGLKTLTVINKACASIRRTGKAFNLQATPLDDKATYDMMSAGDTVGVFQLESTGMRESLRKLKPDRFEDIIAMVALYRPGPMDNIETYINRKYGREYPDYLHPFIRPLLEETYGVIIYQEQVMQIAQNLSGYSLGEADLLRRAMGKKVKAEMDMQKERFIKGAVGKGVDEMRAAFIFELVAKFAGYGFNKSHAAAYALIAYQTAYLKANFPEEFLAATMTLDMGNTDKLYMFSQEARRKKISIDPPSVNHSEVDFVPQSGAIRYSLAALKNMGRSAVEHICLERANGRPFKNLSDFANRINPKIINKRALETLTAAGAFDALEPNRARVFANIDSVLAAAGRSAGDREKGQSDLFGSSRGATALELRPAQSWGLMEMLSHELDAIGFFLSGHPLDEYGDALAKLNIVRWAEFEARVRAQGRAEGRVAGTVIYRQDRKARSGVSFAFAGFSDPTGQFEAVIFSDTLAAAGDVLEAGTAVLLQVECELDGENVKTRVQSAQSLDHALGRVRSGVRIVAENCAGLADLAKKIGRDGRGTLILCLRLKDAKREIEFTLGRNFEFSPRQLGEIKARPGVLSVEAF
jgi:DNA polymerase III subunit alpha